eukprot:TRINITY_DN780040_c0_g1_i1.p1 TRINITY_DN780040_c0_g1~~TRINITY_DN780040_c0_g1_i1.p1  ORF type:complete len:254 (-),score=61.72 TRINITY_DN780040_c0_g1_i1:190-951(-)
MKLICIFLAFILFVSVNAADLDLYVVRLSSSVVTSLNCDLSDAEITALVTKANGIWNKYNVNWVLKSITDQDALNSDDYRKALKNEIHPSVLVSQETVYQSSVLPTTSQGYVMVLVADLDDYGPTCVFNDVHAVGLAAHSKAKADNHQFTQDLGIILGLAPVSCSGFPKNVMVQKCDIADDADLDVKQIAHVDAMLALGKRWTGGQATCPSGGCDWDSNVIKELAIVIGICIAACTLVLCVFMRRSRKDKKKV